jgi:hypothetical protein
MGESARSSFSADELDELFTAAGWRAVESSDARVQRAGFVMAEKT